MERNRYPNPGFEAMGVEEAGDIVTCWAEIGDASFERTVSLSALRTIEKTKRKKNECGYIIKQKSVSFELMFVLLPPCLVG